MYSPYFLSNPPFAQPTVAPSLIRASSRSRTRKTTLPGANSRVTNHARSASEGTRKSLSPGRLRESHFNSGFPWMRSPPPIRSPDLEWIELASIVSGSENMTGIGAGIAVLAQKPDVYPTFAWIQFFDTNSPLTPSTDQTVQVKNRSSMRPRVPPLISPPNLPLASPLPGPILPPLRRAFSEDSYMADRPYSDGAQYLDVSPPQPFPAGVSTPSSSKHAFPSTYPRFQLPDDDSVWKHWPHRQRFTRA